MRLGHARRSRGGQAGQHHGALDLRARDRGDVVDAGQRTAVDDERGMSVGGGDPGAHRVRGSITRRMGRRESDASPMSVDRNGQPASMPASSRIVVPELAASRSRRGPAQARQALAVDARFARAAGARCGRRAARGTATVAATSAPGARWLTEVVPCASAPKHGVPVGDGFVARDGTGCRARRARGGCQAWSWSR